MRTYDIINAGPNNRFLANGRIVSNSGRNIQVQNLPKNYLKDLDLARRLLKVGDYETLEMLYGNVPDTLSQLVRTAIIPADGCRFIIADFSAIEARVIAWMAGERWRMDVFRTHGKIYEASAAQMFKVPIESITKGNPLRQKGKIAELALGYGGAVGALVAMGALNMGLTEDELPGLVNAWRAANPNITKLWWDVEAAAHAAVLERKVTTMQYGLTIMCESDCLFIQLPSGRRLAYARPRIEVDKRFQKPVLTYEGVEGKLWRRLNTYGPKLTENIIQATSRDCLAEALTRLAAAGYESVFHVHDEIIAEMPEGRGSLDEMVGIISQPIKWAPGLPLRADGFETHYYMKGD
jgi:DNA polymerase